MSSFVIEQRPTHSVTTVQFVFVVSLCTRMYVCTSVLHTIVHCTRVVTVESRHIHIVLIAS